MKNSEAFDEIYSNLKRGIVYGENITNVRFPYFRTVLSCDGKYWFWSHYGSSANKATKSELRWILSKIFKLTPIEFLEEYSKEME